MHDQVLTAGDLGAVNRARLVRLLHREGPQSRARLATLLGVSRATVGTIVQPMLDDGVLVQQPVPEGVRAGKPAHPLWFGTSRLLGCVYLSPDRILLATSTMAGEILRRHAFPLRAEDVRAAGEQLRRACAEFFAPEPLVAVGVGAAGMVDTDSGEVITVYRSPALSGLPVTRLLEAELQVPVVIDHHPRIQAIGDLWFGSGRELHSFASLYTGEVLGAGIVHGGRVLRGPRGAGGEIGHIVIDVDGEACECGRTGCWETLATLPWLRREARTLGLPDPDAVTAASLSRTAHRDPRAQALLGRYVDNIAQGLADLEQVLGLGTYLIHGDLAGGGAMTVDLLGERLRALSPHRGEGARVAAVPDEDGATLLGAAGLAMSSIYGIDV